MKMSDQVSMWDHDWGRGKSQMIAVNWAAIGPVSPRQARAFARAVLRMADRVEKRRKKAVKNGVKLAPQRG